MSAFAQRSSLLLSTLFFIITNNTDGLSETLFKVKKTQYICLCIALKMITVLFWRWQLTYQVQTLSGSQRRTWKLILFLTAPPDVSTGNRKAATAMLSGYISLHKLNSKLKIWQLLYVTFYIACSTEKCFWKVPYGVLYHKHGGSVSLQASFIWTLIVFSSLHSFSNSSTECNLAKLTYLENPSPNYAHQQVSSPTYKIFLTGSPHFHYRKNGF